MSNFLLKSPDAVFIHIPKNAGTSIRRGAWGDRFEGPAFGHVPDAWSSYFKFAFTRHPLDRLVSAWKMFTSGTMERPERAKRTVRTIFGFDRRDRDLAAKFPAMTLDEFLRVAMDDGIGFDFAAFGNAKVPAQVKLRHHAIPQTHPYNCLAEADFIGRYETLEDDFAKIARRLGGGLSLPHLRRTQRDGDWGDYFDKDTLDRAVAFYREDFAALGYGLPEPARA